MNARDAAKDWSATHEEEEIVRYEDVPHEE
jgi:hypothetical protein